MTAPLHPGEAHSLTNGAAEAARAYEAVAHGRAHLDYQRRIATASVHGHDARVMSHDRKDASC